MSIISRLHYFKLAKYHFGQFFRRYGSPEAIFDDVGVGTQREREGGGETDRQTDRDRQTERDRPKLM